MNDTSGIMRRDRLGRSYRESHASVSFHLGRQEDKDAGFPKE